MKKILTSLAVFKLCAVLAVAGIVWAGAPFVLGPSQSTNLGLVPIGTFTLNPQALQLVTYSTNNGVVTPLLTLDGTNNFALPQSFAFPVGVTNGFNLSISNNVFTVYGSLNFTNKSTTSNMLFNVTQ